MSPTIVGNLLASAPLDYQQDQIQIFFAFSLAVFVAIGWVAALLVLGVGRYLRSQRIVALGSMGLGVMTIATPLGVYISLILQRGGILEITVYDLAMVSVMGFMGGIIATVAFLRIWTRTSIQGDKVPREMG